MAQGGHGDAARAGGYSSTHIILHHMAPNVLAPYLILLTAYVAQAILLEASLSFLGLGVAEPKPADNSWPQPTWATLQPNRTWHGWRKRTNKGSEGCLKP